MEFIVFYTIAFIFGLVIGSFLNCVIYRLTLPNPSLFSKNAEFSWLKSRSYCPHCKNQLNWRDLIPVFSFLFLKRKCRYCRNKISWQYPLVEIATGLIFLLIFNFQFSIFNEFSITKFLNLAYLFYIASTLIIIFIYDLKHYIIPDKVLFPAIAVSLVYRVLDFSHLNLFGNWKLEIGNFAALSNFILAALIALTFFLTIYLISRGSWIGFGDCKLAILLGLFLGFPNILAALFLAFFFGAIIGTGLIFLNKKSLKSEIPFAPFLITGAFIAMFWGSKIINWYASLIFNLKFLINLII